MPEPVKPPPTPRDLGYRMPAEWGPHRATWLSWPHNPETWPTQLERVKDIWIQMIRELAPHEVVYLLIHDPPARQEVSSRLKAAGAPLDRVVMLPIATVDVWMRDYGPTFIVRQEQKEAPLALNDWIFNGWGGKYKLYERDDGVAREIARLLGLPVFEHPIVLEGGSIEVNGAGLCLTTEQCLLNTNRNPHLDRGEIERYLQDSLGVERIVWLGEGIAGDDTDGHIDDIARFVDSSTVVCAVEADSSDVNYVPLQENLERLKGDRDALGRKLEVVPLPLPGVVSCDGSRLPASYANFYIANQVVLVPIFDHPHDSLAVGLLGELFPARKVIGLRCADVVAGMGAIHCVTQQEPAVGGANS